MAKQHDINSSSITSTKSTASSSDASTEVCGSRPLETSIKSMEIKMVRICRWWGWWEWRKHEAGWLGKCFKMNNTSSMPFAKKKKVCFLSPGKNTQKTNTQKNTVGMKYIKMHFKLRYNRYKKNKTTCDNFLKYVNTLDACVLFFCIVENNWCCHICQSNQNPKQPMTAEVFYAAYEWALCRRSDKSFEYKIDWQVRSW